MAADSFEFLDSCWKTNLSGMEDFHREAVRDEIFFFFMEGRNLWKYFGYLDTHRKWLIARKIEFQIDTYIPYWVNYFIFFYYLVNIIQLKMKVF